MEKERKRGRDRNRGGTREAEAREIGSFVANFKRFGALAPIREIGFTPPEKRSPKFP